MEEALSLAAWSSVVTGVVALLVAASRASVRRTALATAAGAFAVAGILGILSIGLIFIILAILCALAAARTSPATS